MNLKLNLSGSKKAASGYPHFGVKDLEHFKGNVEPGEFVRLQDAMGNFLAHAVSDGLRSPIPFRLMSRERHPEFNAAWFEAAVEQALRGRRALMQENAGLRLIHGEADGLPGVFAELHAGQLLLEIESPGLAAHGAPIEAALWKQAGATSMWVKQGGAWQLRQGSKGGPDFISTVAGMKFKLRLGEAVPQDFGLQGRMDYARLSEFALKGPALCAFSRRGAWAAAALKAGCESVTCLERDTLANTCAAENLDLNGMKAKAEFVQGDALERLEKLEAQGKRFAFVMAEMPRHSKGSRLNFQAGKHGAGLAARVLKLLVPGGVAAFSLAASELSQQGFQNALERGAAEAGKAVETIAASRFAPDFPQISGFEQPTQRRFLALKAKA